MQEGNVVFSPYGIASVSILLLEGTTGNTALEILRVLNLPWDSLLARIGFRDMNRHLKVGTLLRPSPTSKNKRLPFLRRQVMLFY